MPQGGHNGFPKKIRANQRAIEVDADDIPRPVRLGVGVGFGKRCGPPHALLKMGSMEHPCSFLSLVLARTYNRLRPSDQVRFAGPVRKRPAGRTPRRRPAFGSAPRSAQAGARHCLAAGIWRKLLPLNEGCRLGLRPRRVRLFVEAARWQAKAVEIARQPASDELKYVGTSAAEVERELTQRLALYKRVNVLSRKDKHRDEPSAAEPAESLRQGHSRRLTASGS